MSREEPFRFHIYELSGQRRHYVQFQRLVRSDLDHCNV
jgi:hypothetical protein